MNANPQDYKRHISEDHGILYTGLHKQIISSLTIIPFYETDVNLFICRAVNFYRTSQSSNFILEKPEFRIYVSPF